MLTISCYPAAMSNAHFGYLPSDIQTKGDIYREGRAVGQAIRSTILPIATLSARAKNLVN